MSAADATGVNGAPPGPLAGKVAVVTGATRGIGRAIAIGLGAAGARLVAIGRTEGSLEELDDDVKAAGGAPATLVPLDLRKTDLVDRLGAAIADRHGRADVLACAAATIGKLSPVGHITDKAWDEAMAVNATGHFRLLRSLDPLLRKAGAARIVVLTCREVGAAAPFYGHYAASKAALEALARVYAAEAARTGITVDVLDPGPAATRLRKQAFPGEDPANLPTPEDAARPILERLLGAG